MTNDDLARAILDAGSYVVLATADHDGVPWASPVWYAMENYSQLYWVSFPGARHSRNIAVRREVAMVVFNSTVAPGTGQGVYMTGTAQQLTGEGQVDHGLRVFSRKSLRQGIGEFALDRVTGDARLRLYQAQVDTFSILDPDSPFDVRIDVRP